MSLEPLPVTSLIRTTLLLCHVMDTITGDLSPHGWPKNSITYYVKSKVKVSVDVLWKLLIFSIKKLKIKNPVFSIKEIEIYSVLKPGCCSVMTIFIYDFNFNDKEELFYLSCYKNNIHWEECTVTWVHLIYNLVGFVECGDIIAHLVNSRQRKHG